MIEAPRLMMSLFTVTCVSNLNLHVENSTCLDYSVSRNSRSNCYLTMCRLVDSHLESVLCLAAVQSARPARTAIDLMMLFIILLIKWLYHICT